MRTRAELEERLGRYGAAEHIYVDGQGYIAWHYTTGDNLEVLFIDAPGHGAELFAAMVDLLQARGEKPYHSVVVYHLYSNKAAERFYRRLGCQQVDLGRSIYEGDRTVLAWITWEDLVFRLWQLKLLKGAK